MCEENTDSSKLLYYCGKLRESIIKVKDKTILFRDFPVGCCRDSAIILGDLLKNKGFSEICYCRKPYDDFSKSHGWIEVGGYILDLTADQFGDGYPAITMIPKNSSLPIYRGKACSPCYIAIADFDAANLLHDYDLILETLFASI